MVIPWHPETRLVWTTTGTVGPPPPKKNSNHLRMENNRQLRLPPPLPTKHWNRLWNRNIYILKLTLPALLLLIELSKWVVSKISWKLCARKSWQWTKRRTAKRQMRWDKNTWFYDLFIFPIIIKPCSLPKLLHLCYLAHPALFLTPQFFWIRSTPTNPNTTQVLIWTVPFPHSSVSHTPPRTHGKATGNTHLPDNQQVK